MGLVSAATQAAVASAAARVTNSGTFSILRKSTTDGPYGSVETYSAHATDVPGRLSAISAEEVPEGMRINAQAHFKLTLLSGADVIASDRIQGQGKTFDVVSIMEPVTGWQVEMNLLLSLA